MIRREEFVRRIAIVFPFFPRSLHFSTPRADPSNDAVAAAPSRIEPIRASFELRDLLGVPVGRCSARLSASRGFDLRENPGLL